MLFQVAFLGLKIETIDKWGSQRLVLLFKLAFHKNTLQTMVNKKTLAKLIEISLIEVDLHLNLLPI